MRISIVGHDLPGRSFWSPEHGPMENVHVGVQVRKDPEGLVAGDAREALWHLEPAETMADDGSFDFKGPEVHGRKGERFLYLTWGNVEPDDKFTMFARAKLMLGDIDRELMIDATASGRPVVGSIRLQDDTGHPRCARVKPPDLVWSLGQQA